MRIDLRPGDSRVLDIRLLPVRPRVNFTVEEELKPEREGAAPPVAAPISGPQSSRTDAADSAVGQTARADAARAATVSDGRPGLRFRRASGTSTP